MRVIIRLTGFTPDRPRRQRVADPGDVSNQAQPSQSRPDQQEKHENGDWKTPDRQHRVQQFLHRRRDILTREGLTPDERKTLLHTLLEEFNRDRDRPQLLYPRRVHLDSLDPDA